MVMDFFERYEGMEAGLDQTMNQVKEEMKKLNERIQVLRTNAEKLDPTKKTKTTETIRLGYSNVVHGLVNLRGTDVQRVQEQYYTSTYLGVEINLLMKCIIIWMDR